MNRHSAQTQAATVAQIEQLPFVQRITETDRDDATHEVVTNQSLVRVDDELHELDQLPVTIEAFSQIGHYGVHIYLTVS